MTSGSAISQYKATPILLSSNLRKSIIFYSDGLGFAVYKEEDGLRAKRGDLDVKIIPSADWDVTSNLSVIFRVEDAGRLYAEFLDRAVQGISSLGHNCCNKLQFTLMDPDGSTLIFVESEI